jgi:hypothetical protein
MLTETEFIAYQEILTPIAGKYVRRLKQPSIYSLDDLISEGNVLILRLVQEKRRRNEEYFKNLLRRSMINRCKELVIQSYKKPDDRIKQRPLYARLIHTLGLDGLSKTQLDYILFLLTPPAELVELLKNKTHKQRKMICRKHFGLTLAEEKKIEESILIILRK